MSDLPEHVERAVQELKAEIDHLVAGRWDQAENAASSRNLRSQAETVVLSAKKVKEAVTRNTYSAR